MNVTIKISQETTLSLSKDKLEFTSSDNKTVVSERRGFEYKNIVKLYIY